MVVMSQKKCNNILELLEKKSEDPIKNCGILKPRQRFIYDTCDWSEYEKKYKIEIPNITTVYGTGPENMKRHYLQSSKNLIEKNIGFCKLADKIKEYDSAALTPKQTSKPPAPSTPIPTVPKPTNKTDKVSFIDALTLFDFDILWNKHKTYTIGLVLVIVIIIVAVLFMG